MCLDTSIKGNEKKTYKGSLATASVKPRGDARNRMYDSSSSSNAFPF